MASRARPWTLCVPRKSSDARVGPWRPDRPRLGRIGRPRLRGPREEVVADFPSIPILPGESLHLGVRDIAIWLGFRDEEFAQLADPLDCRTVTGPLPLFATPALQCLSRAYERLRLPSDVWLGSA